MTTTLMTVQYQNPHATGTLAVPVIVLCNTPDEVLAANVRANTAKPLRWLKAAPAHDRIAVMVGGGPSVAEYVEEIRSHRFDGAAVFAMNNASRWLFSHGILVDFQVICDAQPATAALVDPQASNHLFASQCDPATVDAAGVDPASGAAILWHLETGEVEKSFHPERPRQKGGYVLIGGGAAVGNSAMCVAYAMGYRRFEVYGYDSSHRGDQGHAYAQPMNDILQRFPVEWGGKVYWSTITMRAQAEKFQLTGQALKQAGCTINVHGDGLLPAMWRTPPAHMTEREKYRRMWEFPAYRTHAPGEEAAQTFVDLVNPTDTIIDFGAGTGRGALALHKLTGKEVILVDFADNCRDHEATALPFLEWDLTHPCPARAPYGYCTDVMEHIPPEDVDAVIRNIMESVETAFFQISTVDDRMGGLIQRALHLTVHPGTWWAVKFRALGFHVAWMQEQKNAVQLLVMKANA